MRWIKGNLPIVLLGVALLSCGAMLLALGHGGTFYQDEWTFVLDRQGFTGRDFFLPHNEHIIVIPTAIEKLLIEVFGLGTYLPERLAMTAAVLIAATLLFVYARRRVGPWPALIATVLLLFLGPAWADLLWPFQIGFVGSALFGIAMLLALDRGDRRGDVAACACLALSLGFSSLGLPFVAAAATDVLVRRRSHGLGRAWVAAIPAALYAAWWLTWGHQAPRHVTLENVLASPRYVLEGMAAAVEALLGLNQSESGPDVAVPPDWGVPILLALVGLAVYRQMRRPGVSQRFWPLAAAAFGSWALAAFNAMPGREAYQNRYLYAGGVFVLLLAAELLRGIQISRRALLVSGAVTLAAVSMNLVHFRDGGRWFRDQGMLARTGGAAIEIARRTVDPTFQLTADIAGTGSLWVVVAGTYLQAVDEHGSPAYSLAELAEAPAAARRQADIVLARALPLSTAAADSSAAPLRGSCVLFAGGAASRSLETALPPGTARIHVSPGPPASLSLRRFAADEFPVALDAAPGGETTMLRIPRDHASRPWHLNVGSSQPVRVCS